MSFGDELLAAIVIMLVLGGGVTFLELRAPAAPACPKAAACLPPGDYYHPVGYP